MTMMHNVSNRKIWAWITCAISSFIFSSCGLFPDCPYDYYMNGNVKIDTLSVFYTDSSTMETMRITNKDSLNYRAVSSSGAAGSSNLVSDLYTQNVGHISISNNKSGASESFSFIGLQLDSIVATNGNTIGTATFKNSKSKGIITSSLSLSSRISKSTNYQYTVEVSDTLIGYLKFTVTGTINPQEETCYNHD